MQIPLRLSCITDLKTFRLFFLLFMSSMWLFGTTSIVYALDRQVMVVNECHEPIWVAVVYWQELKESVHHSGWTYVSPGSRSHLLETSRDHFAYFAYSRSYEWAGEQGRPPFTVSRDDFYYWFSADIGFLGLENVSRPFKVEFRSKEINPGSGPFTFSITC